MKGKSKVPEKATTDKLRYYKGVVKELTKELRNLKDRVGDLETQMSKIYTNPKKYTKTKASIDERERELLLKKYNPDYKKDGEK